MDNKDRNLLLLIVVLILFSPYIGGLLIALFALIMTFLSS